MINRCPSCHEHGNDATRCFLDLNHTGDHRWFGDPGKPPMAWPNLTIWQRVTRRVMQ